MPETDGGENFSSGSEQTTRRSILAEQIEEGIGELERPSGGLLLSALSAGLDVGFGPFLMVTVATLASGVWTEATMSIVLANLYAVGFIFVVLGRSELFTEHTTLAVLPVIDGRASLSELGRLWGLVYAGNIVGASLFAGIVVLVAPAYGIVDPSAFVDIGKKLVGHPPLVMLSAAILAGWLMGLLSWLVAAAQETISRVFFVWIIATTIGIAHLPHSIAGTVEVLAAVLVDPAMGFATFGEFLVLSTAGNAIGGSVFVALLKYGHVVREA
ncbi:formate/nitrite transporter family protein [Halogeometricum limi]|uniref:Formate/nitrite transporter FocA, FNT family n=1 Tax=Halogeometricum limi TaxID=555875 RepID=A0A1I6FTZ3_9EURY|nr:formate/nitrite transporter family protein [Halogeometricum limi]SFR33393.1 Formate/nitrite transporter FocA, FNT family [Halogeometricum limi]